MSPYLTEDVLEGDQFELRGPIGGYFAWDAARGGPLLLVGGGSGLVPLMAMLRHRRDAGSQADARLLLSARTIEDVLYREELEQLASAAVWPCTPRSRAAPADGWQGWTRRIDREMLLAVGPEPAARAAHLRVRPDPVRRRGRRALVALGHEPATVHTERFGPTGG